MCNPPFFETMEEAELSPKTSCGGTPKEMGVQCQLSATIDVLHSIESIFHSTDAYCKLNFASFTVDVNEVEEAASGKHLQKTSSSSSCFHVPLNSLSFRVSVCSPPNHWSFRKFLNTSGEMIVTNIILNNIPTIGDRFETSIDSLLRIHTASGDSVET
ncbi:hypothetical protein Dsin_025725 [Dipteronia sinensis]|uniref:Uncharacterized protein n=1 Tax=Dipteronia sinensis TaxID=43782 RepID=A0AAE0DX32_9ROSI|nr:hypothetical protein Dsin_025725 [Dipteronia sinensis]